MTSFESMEIPLFSINFDTGVVSEAPDADITLFSLDYNDNIKQKIIDCGWYLTKIPIEKRTSELCEIAVKCNGCILKFVPFELRTEKLCDLAFTSNGTSFKYFTPELFEKKINEMKSFINEERFDNMMTDDIAFNLFQTDGNNYKFIPNNVLDKIIDTVNDFNVY